ncbi:MAG: hypothetical protein ACREIC_05205, partial [Limisphaerales bacterium]
IVGPLKRWYMPTRKRTHPLANTTSRGRFPWHTARRSSRDAHTIVGYAPTISSTPASELLK